MGTSGRAVLRRVVEQMRADPAVLQSVVDAARAGSAPVAALPEQEVKRHIAGLLAVVSAAFIDAGGLAGEQVQLAARLAADRAAQGVPLTALLAGFRAGRTQVLRDLAERLHDAAVPFPAFLDLLVELDSYTGELQDRLIAAYRESELALAAASRTARIGALREVLLEGAVERLPAAGLDPGGRYHLLLADLGDPQLTRELGTGDGASGLVEGRWCVVSAQPSSAPAGLCVTAPPVPATLLPTAYRLSRAALEAAKSRGLAGRRRLTDLAVPVALDAAPGLGTLLAAELLTGLDPDDTLHRLLAETALAYLTHGRRLDRTAQALHVHPNTVKYRLRRLGELTPFAATAAADDLLATGLRWRWALESRLGG